MRTRPASEDAVAGAEPTRSAARGVAPVVSVLLLLVLSTTGAALAAAAVHGVPPIAASASADHATPSLSLSVDGRTLVVVNHGGGTLDVARVDLLVRVDGTLLRHQPPVPFFAARGYRGGPTGAFNVASDRRLSPGEFASVRIAATNEPLPERGSNVTLVVVVDGERVASLTTTAR